MKKIAILLISSALVLSSCSKWLEVEPQGQSTEDKLFSTQKGFKDALTGAYIRIKSDRLYGSNLGWGAVEQMALNWDPLASNVNNVNIALRAGRYSDEGVREILDNIFEENYKVILDVNGILSKIDAKQSVFEKDYYELIKGESLALRALAHFEAMRMFGPVPSNPTSKKWLPYVKEITKDIHEGLDFRSFMQAILADLDAAEVLLAEHDPIRNYTFKELRPEGDKPFLIDPFLSFRDTRLNYFSILALKARVYQWMAAADPQYGAEALKYAKLVIDATTKGQKVVRLGLDADRVAGDYTMSPEHLFAIDMFKMDERMNGIFGEDGSLMRADFGNSSSWFYLGNLFPANERNNDIRFKDMWFNKTKPGETGYVRYMKFMPRSADKINRIPIIRLSEMYLIATEFAIDKQTAEQYYRVFADAKGFPFIAFTAGNWETDRRNKLIREYVREFYAEGKSFLNYKRLNVINLPSSWTNTYYVGSEARYVVPKPLREIDYNK